MTIRRSTRLENMLMDERPKAIEVSERIDGVSVTQWIRGQNVVAEFYRNKWDKQFWLNEIKAEAVPKDLAEARKRVSVKYKVVKG